MVASLLTHLSIIMPVPTPTDFELMAALSDAIAIVESTSDIVLYIIGFGIGSALLGLIITELKKQVATWI